MKYFVVASNRDTITGFRLVGVEGTLVHEKKAAAAAIQSAIDNPDIGVLLVTEDMAALCQDTLRDLKQGGSNTGGTLVVEIPDRHGSGRAPDSITRYIRESIGVNI